eukprot:353037-Chlamydomonas_euryale.AAC.4
MQQVIPIYFDAKHLLMPLDRIYAQRWRKREQSEYKARISKAKAMVRRTVVAAGWATKRGRPTTTSKQCNLGHCNGRHRDKVGALAAMCTAITVDCTSSELQRCGPQQDGTATGGVAAGSGQMHAAGSGKMHAAGSCLQGVACSLACGSRRRCAYFARHVSAPPQHNRSCCNQSKT